MRRARADEHARRIRADDVKARKKTAARDDVASRTRLLDAIADETANDVAGQSAARIGFDPQHAHVSSAHIDRFKICAAEKLAGRDEVAVQVPRVLSEQAELRAER
jgi:hypothetical protein